MCVLRLYAMNPWQFEGILVSCRANVTDRRRRGRSHKLYIYSVASLSRALQKLETCNSKYIFVWYTQHELIIFFAALLSIKIDNLI